MPRKAAKKTAAKPAPAAPKNGAKKPAKKVVNKKGAKPQEKLASKPVAAVKTKPAKTAPAAKAVMAKKGAKSAPVKPIVAKPPVKPATKPASNVASKSANKTVAAAKAIAPPAPPAKKVATPIAPPPAAKVAKPVAKVAPKKVAAKAKPGKKNSLAANATAPAKVIPLAAALNQVRLGDCVEQMNQLPEGSIDLVFADPPFNIGFKYDVYKDKRKGDEYLDWSKSWISAVHRALKSDGTFWLAIGDEYAAELKVMAQQIGFTCRSWVIWYYTFGVNCKLKFSRSHAHLFHFVKNPKKFTFRADAKENRIPSARQLVYNDNRSNPEGRLPDDTWILRPQDLQDCFSTEEDTWYFPRVAGTFKEREGFHGCQMPEQLLGRIIRICSHKEEIVLDPFSGSGTTLVVAKKLGRQFVGFDVSEEYVKRGQERLAKVSVDDALHGAKEPLMSAPATAAGKRLSDRKKKKKLKKKPVDAPVSAESYPADIEVISHEEVALRENPLFPGLEDLALSPHVVEPDEVAAEEEAIPSPQESAPEEEKPHEQYSRFLF